MAPTRKSRVNMRYSDYFEASPTKSVRNSNKSGRQKRKLSDMLGSPWTDEEVECFYKAYRKYGKEWKKVAAMVRSRTVEMVEALYTMNRAYLSLPEGTASVAGFVAMVSDHYNALEGSDDDEESNELPKLIHNSKKRSRGLLKINGMKDHKLQSKVVGSSDGRSLLLKRRESDGCTVRKRTPRIPINYSSRKHNAGDTVSPYKRSHKREVDDVAHGAALALAEASHGGDSPQVSLSPHKAEHMKSTSLKGKQKMTVKTKLRGKYEDYFEDSSGSGGAENGIPEDVAAEEVYQRGRKFHGKKDYSEYEDGGEACSGTGGLSVGSVGAKYDIEVGNENFEQSSSQGKRKRNKNHFVRDETSGLDALQTLADLSLMIQSSNVEYDKPPTGLSDNSITRRASSTGHWTHKTKVPADKQKLANQFPRANASKSGKSKPRKELVVDYKALSEGKKLPQYNNKSWKRKSKSSSIEAFVNEEEKLGHNVISADRDNTPSKNCKSTRLVEYSSSNSTTSRTGADSAVSTAPLSTDGVDLLPRHRNRRKLNLSNKLNYKEMKATKTILNYQPNKKLKLQEGSFYSKDKSSCCLSSHMVRRWATFEWFYSAIDYPWFAKREFMEYLNHVGLGHIPRLTHVEWGVIKSSLGKPRRFSSNFLNEEREKLRQYRECVRKHYSELRSGVKEGLPTDLARPLSVGQRVTAIHPESREVHDGSVLTVDHDKCRIQFDRPELGVAFVTDIDCMPLNILENMPEALRRENIGLYSYSLNSGDPGLLGSAARASRLLASSELLKQTPMITFMNQGQGVKRFDASDNVADVLPQHAAYPPCSAAQTNARETDIRVISELARALDKKEAILTELKFVNDALMKNKEETGIPVVMSEGFMKQYTTVLLQLKEASDQVSYALLNLRQRNTYPGNALPCQKLHPNPSGFVGSTNSVENSLMNNHLATGVVEIINNSRHEAQKLVHAAIQALSRVKGDQNAYSSVVAALDSLGEGKNPHESVSSISRSSEQANGGLAYKHKLNHAPEPIPNGHSSDLNLQRDSDGTEMKLPSDLIMSCVATYHMIQMCTERQYPPADVVQMLDSAVSSLHPCCPQNLAIYREIQMCMGRVKTQILALVPS